MAAEEGYNTEWPDQNKPTHADACSLGLTMRPQNTCPPDAQTMTSLTARPEGVTERLERTSIDLNLPIEKAKNICTLGTDLTHDTSDQVATNPSTNPGGTPPPDGTMNHLGLLTKVEVGNHIGLNPELISNTA